MVITLMMIGLAQVMSLARAADLPQIDCVVTDKVVDDQAVSKITTFPTDQPSVHLFCQSDKVSMGQTIKAVWIAADTNGVAPDNYKIDEKGLMLEEDLGDDKIWTADYQLSKPAKGWPKGSYHVDLYVDEALYKSYDFTFK